MTESQHITLRELQRRVKSALEGQFALPLWVSAEISEIKVNLLGPLLPGACGEGRRQRRADSAGPSRRVAFGTTPHRRLFRGRNGPAARRGHQNTCQGAGHLPRTLRLLAPAHRHRPLLHAGRHGAAAAADHRAVAAGGRLGHEPRGADAGRRAARGHRVERQRRRLSGLLQGAGPKPLPFRADPVRRLHAGRSGRGIHHRSPVQRRGPAGKIRRRGADPRRRVEERPQLLQRLAASAPTWRSSRCRW